MNTGFVRPAVATALTVYGIETSITRKSFSWIAQLQQHLPFTVLKLHERIQTATTPSSLQQHLPFTVLKLIAVVAVKNHNGVATALTVYGIETTYSRKLD